MFSWLFSQAKNLIKPIGEFLGKEVLQPIKTMVFDGGKDFLRDTISNFGNQITSGSFNPMAIVEEPLRSYRNTLKRKAIDALHDVHSRYAPNQTSQFEGYDVDPYYKKRKRFRPAIQTSPVQPNLEAEMNDKGYEPKDFEEE